MDMSGSLALSLLMHEMLYPLQVPAGYVNISSERFAKQPQTRKRSRLFSTAATDIFGKASMDPYSFGVLRPCA